MKIERDERRLDFRDIGVAIKKAREDAGMTQEQLAYIIDRDSEKQAVIASACPDLKKSRYLSGPVL